MNNKRDESEILNDIRGIYEDLSAESLVSSGKNSDDLQKKLRELVSELGREPDLYEVYFL